MVFLVYGWHPENGWIDHSLVVVVPHSPLSRRAVGAGPANDDKPCPRRGDEVVERGESGHPTDEIADGHVRRGDVIGAI